MRISDWSSDVCSSDLSADGAATSVVSVGDVALVVGFGVKGFSGNIGFGEDRKQVDPEPLELLVRIHQLAYDLVDDAGCTSRVFDPVDRKSTRLNSSH